MLVVCINTLALTKYTNSVYSKQHSRKTWVSSCKPKGDINILQQKTWFVRVSSWLLDYTLTSGRLSATSTYRTAMLSQLITLFPRVRVVAVWPFGCKKWAVSCKLVFLFRLFLRASEPLCLQHLAFSLWADHLITELDQLMDNASISLLTSLSQQPIAWQHSKASYPAQGRGAKNPYHAI